MSTTQYTSQHMQFTFNASKEDEPIAALNLFFDHFPLAKVAIQGHRPSVLLNTPFLVTCHTDEFVSWLISRCDRGFTNRIKQLQLKRVQPPRQSHNTPTLPKVIEIMTQRAQY